MCYLLQDGDGEVSKFYLSDGAEQLLPMPPHGLEGGDGISKGACWVTDKLVQVGSAFCDLIDPGKTVWLNNRFEFWMIYFSNSLSTEYIRTGESSLYLAI